MVKKQNKFYLAIGIVAIILIVFVLISSFNQQEKDIIKIGVITPLTGFSQEHGQNIMKGIELAYSQVNNSKIELIFENSKCDAKEGINAYNFLKIKGVNVIIGTVCSGVTLAISPLAEKDKIVLISATASSPEISNAGEHIFRVYPSDELDAEIISKFVNGKKIAIVSINNDYGEGVLSNLRKKIGNQIILNEKFEFGESDFRSILTKVKFLKPEKIILIGYPDNTLEFLKQAREFDLNQIIIGSSATFTANLLGKKYKNFYFTSPDMSPKGREYFVKSYKSKYNLRPAYPSEYGYDNFLVLAKALQNGSVNQLKKTLYKISTVGATGNISFNDKGDRTDLKIEVYAINDSSMECIFNCD